MRRKISLLVLLCCVIAGSGVGNVGAQTATPSMESAREHYYQGVFYGKHGKYVEAIMELEKAIELYPGYANAYNALAVVYHLQKDYPKAIEQYILAIETDPKHVKARTNLAMIYHEQKEYRKAVRQLEAALEIDPNYAPAKALLEKVRSQADAQDAKELERQQEEAKRAPQTPIKPPEPVKSSAPTIAIAVKPKESVFALGTKLLKEGKLDGGIREYRKELKKQSRSAEGYTLLGMAYREKYRITQQAQFRQEEVAALQQAVKFDSTYVPALLALGEVYYEQGAISESVTCFRNVLRYQPNHPAKEQIEQFLNLQKNNTP